MSVWLTPEKAPLFAGTYFPARDGDRGPHPGFLRILAGVADKWRDPAFAGHGAQIVDALRARRGAPGSEALPPLSVVDGLAAEYERRFDPRWGGFGRAPKFPRPSSLDLLQRVAHRTGARAPGEMVATTLVRMACGGMYDHVGGGFARYSTDERWLVPHFEKMLYDNAQLARSYVEGWQATGRGFFADVARDVLDYLAREMSHPDGGFYSATDADSEGEEGLFFVWTPDEIDALLEPDDAAWLKRTFDVSAAGNFEGRNVLNLAEPLSTEDASRWRRIRPVLYGARAERVHPGLDDKIITAWNGLAIGAFAHAGRALDAPAYVERAARAAEFVLSEMRIDGRLRRAWRAGRARHDAVLEDYAAMVGACLDLLEATGDPRWLDEALALQATQDDLYADAERGGYFRTPSDGEPLPFREKPDHDGAEPSGNALAAENLVRLALVTGEARFRDGAERTVRSFDHVLQRAPIAAPKLCAALQALHDPGPRQIVLVSGDDGAEGLRGVLRGRFLPNAVVLRGAPDGALAGRSPLFGGRGLLDGRSAAYVCVGTVCDLPTADPKQLERLLGGTPDGPTG
jgi:uncharacterized protein YyaL (SSP411 family)